MNKERNNSRWKVRKKLAKLKVIQFQEKKRVKRKEKKYTNKESKEQEVKKPNQKREFRESLLPEVIVDHKRDILWQKLKSKLKSS